jgi:hypothetical protein
MLKVELMLLHLHLLDLLFVQKWFVERGPLERMNEAYKHDDVTGYRDEQGYNYTN